MEFLTDPSVWGALITLTFLEIVLGVDNIIFISIAANKLAKEEQAKAVGGDVPLGRIGQPSDIQGASLFLCSPAGAYVTGAILPLDGGIHLITGGNLFGAAM